MTTSGSNEEVGGEVPVSAVRPASRAPAPAMPIIRRLIGISLVYWRQLVGIALLGAAFTLMRYLRAYLIQPALDEIAIPALSQTAGANPMDLVDPDRLMLLGGLLLLTLILTPPAMVGRMYLGTRIVACVRRDLDQGVARRLLHAPLRRHETRSTGDFLSRAMADTHLAVRTLDVLYREMMINVLMLVGGVVAMYTVSWQLATLSLITIIPLAALLRFFGTRIQRKAERRQESQSDLMQLLVSMLGGIREIKVFRGQEREGRRFAEETNRFFRRVMRVVWNQVLAKGATEALNQTLGAAIILLGFYCALNGYFDLTLGKLANFGAIMMTVYKPIKGLSANFSNLMECVAGADRLFTLLDVEDERDDDLASGPMPAFKESIRFRDVDFGYGAKDGEGLVLKGVDFEVPRGQFVAIVGRTGSGKSTLLDLLLRFHKPTRGRVEIDGVDLATIERDAFLDHVAVVAQEPFLFNETIFENIRYGRPDASREEIEDAARVASAHEFIMEQEQGYETPVGEFGAHLSHGQRQRIAIARAMLADPDILIFDEATSALDTMTERAVQEAIDASRGARTVFVVAHRLSTIRSADRIFVLEGGRIAESGSHESLMEQGGLYRNLVEASERA